MALAVDGCGISDNISNLFCIGVPALGYFGFGLMYFNFQFHFCLSFDLNMPFCNFYCKFSFYLPLTKPDVSALRM
jgi:hypothetical protein